MGPGEGRQRALSVIREEDPKSLAAAIPVASREARLRIRPLADRIICLRTPEDFRSVSQFTLSFPRLGDEEVRQSLEKRSVRASDQRPG